jgi:hypothetical protein
MSRTSWAMIDDRIPTGANVVAVAGPSYIQMFADGIRAVQPDETRRIKAFDISEPIRWPWRGRFSLPPMRIDDDSRPRSTRPDRRHAAG